ncbi:DUF2809 domain-containing protein [Chitinilyticum piscinae]|uniref:DUF2809 domain-containing protein n=1 Tax=Chitinilyticum piscinae TaxID=2866724 RepID=A0A8J7FQT8_9NEIS|nr:DUF2809 domain-containing protein [Chitinilyticum piscinae]MBE9609051.1 DUF2809 domain-containing protein [Chitinilyticum piscinae]
MTLRFSPHHALLTLLLLGGEIIIGRYLHGGIIRAYGGDVLVIPLLYCAARTFWHPIRPLLLPVGLLGLGALTELLQALQLADRLRLSNPSLPRTLIGSHADPLDLLAYLLGALLILLAQHYWRRRNSAA